MRSHHDVGGLPAGPVQPNDHQLLLWEKRVHAMLVLLADPSRDLVNVHELRRGIEALGSQEYDRLKYYERWITSITNILLQKGVLSPQELGQKLAEIEGREATAP